MPTTEPTHYDTLGVAADASPDDIKRAFRRIARESHPDVAPDRADIFAAASAAYEVLADPNARAAYDEALASPPEPEPVDLDEFDDSWSSQVEWEIVDDPPPNDANPPTHPPPSPSPGVPGATLDAGARAGNSTWPPEHPDRPRLKYPAQAAVRSLAVLGGCLLVLAALAWLRPSSGVFLAAPRARLTVVVLALVVGVVVGFITKRAKPLSGLTWLLVPVVGVAVEVLAPAGLLSALRGFTALLAGYVGGALVADALRRQRTADTLVPRATLRTHNLFGRLPGGVAADLLDRDLGVLGALRSARMMRCGVPDLPFTHMVCVGDRVAYLSAVVGLPGEYRWSGPSLLVQQPGQHHPAEVMRCDYPAALRQVQADVGRKVAVQSWLVVYPAHPGPVEAVSSVGFPTVGSADRAVEQVKAFLTEGNDLGTVDQERFTDATLALYPN